MYLLDTDTLTHLTVGHALVTARYAAVAAAEIGTTIVSKAELLRGRLDFLLKAADEKQLFRAQELLLRTETVLSRLIIVPFDHSAHGVLEGLVGTRGLKKLGRADLLIASIVLANKATLVTRNLRDFRRIPNLQVANWVD